MRVRITGKCQRTGERARLEIDAASASEAVAQAHADEIDISSVSVLESGQWVQREQRRSVRPKPPSGWALLLKVVGLVFAAFLSMVFPWMGALAAGLLLLVVLLHLVPSLRAAAQRIMGVNAERPVRAALRLMAVVGYAGILALFSWSGVELQAARAERLAKVEAANTRFEELVTSAQGSLEQGEVADAKGLLVEAGRVRLAERKEVAAHLLDSIELATSPERARSLLLILPKEEFESFANGEGSPPSLDLRYPVLTDGLLALVLPQVSGVAAERVELAAKRAAEAERAREQAELQLVQAEKDLRAKYKAEQPALKRSAEMAWEREKKRKKKARTSSREERIMRQFSGWDGSHRKLERHVKDAMNDPGSYDHVSTTHSDMGDYLAVTLTYRGKNGFGGVVKNWVQAKVSLDGDVVAILAVGP